MFSSLDLVGAVGQGVGRYRDLTVLPVCSQNEVFNSTSVNAPGNKGQF